MKNLIKDIKATRPLLIQAPLAFAFLERVKEVPAVYAGAKMNEIGDVLQAMFGKTPVYEKFPPFAIIPIKGVIGKGLTDYERLCGCCDIEDVEEMIEDAERDPSITKIIFKVDSPGGCSVGVPEVSKRIKNCTKETIGFTEKEACSAAFWMASQCDTLYATPSSTVGSVGVYIAYADESGAYANAGVKMNVIKAGLYKGAGLPGTSLDENQMKMLQDEVLEIWDDFKAAVKGVRTFVDDASMEGQTFSGKKAAEAGLVTGLVDGWDELMEKLDPAVAKQMEADEENDARHGEALIDQEIEEEESELHKKMVHKPKNFLAGISLKSKSEKSDEDDDDEDGEEPEKEKAGRLPTKADEEDEAKGGKKHLVVVSDYMGTIKKHNEDEDEEVNDSVVRHLKRMEKSGKKVHIVSAHPESDRIKISDFLEKKKVKHHALHLKPDEDKRPAAEYKVDVIKKLEEEGHHISHCIEDDEDCQEAYEEEGWHPVHPDTIKRMDEENENEDAWESENKHDKKDLPRHKSRGVA